MTRKRTAPPDKRHEPYKKPDKQFGQQVRKIHILMRQVHHLGNIAVKRDAENKDEPLPASFRRITDYLINIIKPVY